MWRNNHKCQFCLLLFVKAKYGILFYPWLNNQICFGCWFFLRSALSQLHIIIRILDISSIQYSNISISWNFSQFSFGCWCVWGQHWARFTSLLEFFTGITLQGAPTHLKKVLQGGGGRRIIAQILGIKSDVKSYCKTKL